MSTTENYQAWSKTAATNANADTSINWAEGQDAATVNNSARSMMAATAKYIDDIGGQLTSAGTANALTVVTNQVLSSAHLAAGLRILMVATFDNTSTTVTLNADGTGLRNIKRADGSALAIGSIKSGMSLDLVYNAGSSEWRCANIAPAAGAVLASFRAYRPTDQVIATIAITKIGFPNTSFDTGSHFSSGAWTPPAGTALIMARVNYANIGSGTVAAAIYKNNVQVAVAREPDSTGTVRSVVLQFIDQPIGTDYYEVFSSTSADASYTIVGGADETMFSGTML